MPVVDMPLTELERYKPDLTHEPDFDAFWRDTLAAARDLGGRPATDRVDTGIRAVDTYDVTFPGPHARRIARPPDAYTRPRRPDPRRPDPRRPDPRWPDARWPDLGRPLPGRPDPRRPGPRRVTHAHPPLRESGAGST